MSGNPRHFPHIGCHEFAGTVVALSESPADATKDFPVGTRVGVPGRGYGTCGKCFECLSIEDYIGFSNNCVKGLSNGLSKVRLRRSFADRDCGIDSSRTEVSASTALSMPVN